MAGEIAVLADPDHPLDSADAILDRLQDHSQADVVELFLAAPAGDELFLISHQGRDVEAFGQQERFRIGEGFPGIALRARRPVRSCHLESDADFLRSRVKSLHYRSAVCVPFTTGGQTGGCLLFAWRTPDADHDRAAWLAAVAAGPLGTTLELAHARSRLRVLGDRAGMLDGQGWFRAPTAAASAALIVLPSRGPGAEPAVRPPDGRAGCPAERGGIQVLGGRSGWPEPCLRAGCVAAARYCIPLAADGAIWGVATVAFRERAPVPLTRYVPVTLWQTQDLRAPPTPDPRIRTLVAASTVAARLDIRCFGGFDVRCDGRPLRRADFGREKARELLALLVAAGGRSVPGDRLAETLWPGADPTPARNRFHVTLSALRRTIEPPDRQHWTHVRRDGRGYFLDPRSSAHVDLWRFDELLRQAEAAAGRPDLERVRRVALEEAVVLYQGEVFAEQFSAGWPDEVARRRREAVRQARERLAGLQARTGEPHAGHGRPADEAVRPRPTLRSKPMNVTSQASSAT